MGVAEWHGEWLKHHDVNSSWNESIDGMKQLSIFHKLPYWRNLLINHLLDPMHIFKNVGESLWNHIIGIKDNSAARKDLQAADVKRPFWIQYTEGGDEILPSVPRILTKEQLSYFKHVIKQMRTFNRLCTFFMHLHFTFAY